MHIVLYLFQIHFFTSTIHPYFVGLTQPVHLKQIFRYVLQTSVLATPVHLKSSRMTSSSQNRKNCFFPTAEVCIRNLLTGTLYTRSYCTTAAFLSASEYGTDCVVGIEQYATLTTFSRYISTCTFICRLKHTHKHNQL